MTAKVTVWPHKRPAGWDGQDFKEGEIPFFHTGSIVDALNFKYDTDAHFVPYRLEKNGVAAKACPRLNLSCLEHLHEYDLKVAFDVAVVDLDDPDAHKNKTVTTPAWHNIAWDQCLAVCPDALLYETARGMRMIVGVPPNLSIEAYEKHHKKLLKYLVSVGLPVDLAAGWNRCYRLAYVVRDGKLELRRTLIREPALFVIPEVAGAAKEATGKVKTPREQAHDDLPARFKLPRRIEEGERHENLKKCAAQLRDGGLDTAKILEQLRYINANRCKPPSPDDELVDLANWAGKQNTGEQDRQAERQVQAAQQAQVIADITGQEVPEVVDNDDDDEGENAIEFQVGDHMEIAKFIAQKLMQDSPEPMVSDLGEIWRYNAESGLWEIIPEYKINLAIMAFSGSSVRFKLSNGGFDWRPLKVNADTVTGSLKVLHKLLTRGEFFKDAPSGTAFADGWYSITGKGIKKHAHSPLHKARWGYDFAWTDVEPVYWNQILWDYFGHLPDYEVLVKIINEFLGASLAGVAGRFQVALILLGEGANGKSTLLEIIKKLFPKGSVAYVNPQNFSKEYNRAALANALLNIVGEMSERKLTATAAAAFKALVSGDEIDARHIYKPLFTFTPRAGHMVACNRLPEVEDDSDGFFRRFRILKFDKQFSAPTANSRQIHATVLEENRAEIVCAALRAVPELLNRGSYLDAKGSVDEVTKWRTDQNEIALFLEDCAEPCEAVRGNGISGNTLYVNYQVWADQNSYEKIKKHKFLSQLSRLHKKFRDHSTEQYVYALRLKIAR